MSSRIRWSERAQANLLEIFRFIASDNPVAARPHLALLRRRARMAARYPRAGRVVPEVNRDDIREIVVGGYRIFYQVVPRGIEVLAVFESHRQPPA